MKNPNYVNKKKEKAIVKTYTVFFILSFIIALITVFQELQIK
jgi:hypothetical protein